MQGSFQTSLFNAFLCIFGLFVITPNNINLIIKKSHSINKIYYLLIAGIILQIIFYRSSDGRPKMGYEMNLSGAYLFLFFLFSDIFNKRSGKIFVMILSLILLSRLLIYSIGIFYVVRFGKVFLKNKIHKINIFLFLPIVYIIFSLFSIWYTLNIKSDIAYETDISRVTDVNDGSNKLRFGINSKVIFSIFQKDKNLLWGYGDIHKNKEYIDKFFLMPHMELFDILVEYGVFILFFFGIFMLYKFNHLSYYNNFEFIISLLFYTLFLWIRFLLVPSFESIFILILLYISDYKNKLKYNKTEKESGKELLFS